MALKVAAATAKQQKKANMDMDLMQKNASRASGVMKLLSHPHRLMILCQLNQGEMSVGELANLIGINQSPLSQHLARMRHEGVVTARRDAQTVYYSIAEQDVGAIVALLYELFCE
jgi:DNA-binding transcriptional ArsR family regulator